MAWVDVAQRLPQKYGSYMVRIEKTGPSGGFHENCLVDWGKAEWRDGLDNQMYWNVKYSPFPLGTITHWFDHEEEWKCKKCESMERVIRGCKDVKEVIDKLANW